MSTETPKRKTRTPKPFEQLLDSSLRLNSQRNTADLHGAIVEEATSLLGSQRVLLVLPEGKALHIAGALLPAGECCERSLLVA